ncbi:PspA/IM30 family protein [Paenibacillus sp. BSR1-1]|uniref:PspA/IM30 family protein n=1 Tax=Paenibacillus sp. BSR1-1 TaxID=3020845 RepID=UPI0025AED06D|nr:PspA/IM30 family protein [Paenibacillus sp. BSR1-1]MDN3016432.1 PspA/IM30 family protein [Paenibacillus sp. BSR1-1]
MSNLFTKIKDLIVADLNETLHQKETQNPISKLNQYLRQCEQETEKVGKLVERHARLKDEFLKEYNLAAELAEKRKHQAEIASNAGETELYQFAAAEHQQFVERSKRLSSSLTEANEQLSELKRKYEEMKHKLKDMHLRRMELMGRENVTRANIGMNQVLDANSSQSHSYSKFKDIDNYLDGLEHKIKRAFNQSSIDDRIAQLEKEMGHKSLNLTKE